MKIKKNSGNRSFTCLDDIWRQSLRQTFVQDDFRKVNQKAFKPVRNLTFEINYGFITANKQLRRSIW
ncbi:MAG: hypothetical protein IPL67_06310 [Ignavibacteria bacterium]|nr:hypothetical protein [Ignavibacteria bacterium]